MKTQRFMFLESAWPGHDAKSAEPGPMALRVEVAELAETDVHVHWPNRAHPNRIWARALAQPAAVEALEALPEAAEVLVRPGRLRIQVPETENTPSVIGRLVKSGQILAEALAQAVSEPLRIKGPELTRQLALNNI